MRLLSLIGAAALPMGVAILLAQSAAKPAKKEVRKSMSQSQGQFVWVSTPENYAERPQVHFSFGPGTGLMDVDFHPVTDKNWKAMASPSPQAVALLEVPASVNMTQLGAAIKAITTKGGYRLIEVRVRQE